MRRPRRGVPEATPLTHEADQWGEALTVAMALAPGVYARNRMYDFFTRASVRRAKARAATLRGIVRQLVTARALELRGAEPTTTAAHVERDFVLQYEVPALRLSRVVELSRVELAALRLLAANARVTSLPIEEADRTYVDEALKRLLNAPADTAALARVARDRVTPSTVPPVGNESTVAVDR